MRVQAAAGACAYSQLDPCCAAVVLAAALLSYSARCMAYAAVVTRWMRFWRSSSDVSCSATVRSVDDAWLLPAVRSAAVAMRLTVRKPFMRRKLLVSQTGPIAPVGYTKWINADVSFITASSSTGSVAPSPAVLWPTSRCCVDVCSNKREHQTTLIPPSVCRVQLLNCTEIEIIQPNKIYSQSLHDAQCDFMWYSLFGKRNYCKLNAFYFYFHLRVYVHWVTGHQKQILWPYVDGLKLFLFK